MPRHALNGIFLFATVIAVAMAVRETDLRQDSSRRPASLSKKEMLLGDTKGPLNLKYTQKLHGPLESKIELVGALPEKAGDVFVLKGTVYSGQTLRDVNFLWALPKEVSIINGSVGGHISYIDVEHPIEVQITLKTLVDGNHQVHLITSGQNNGIKFAESTQYNTLLQAVLDESKEQLLRSSEKSLAEENRQLKVYH